MSDFKLRTGKYQGKSLAWVEQVDPKYIQWVKENRPEMLVERQSKKSDPTSEAELPDERPNALKSNMNFDNEGKKSQ